jgi:hypothetical protein
MQDKNVFSPLIPLFSNQSKVSQKSESSQSRTQLTGSFDEIIELNSSLRTHKFICLPKTGKNQ